MILDLGGVDRAPILAVAALLCVGRAAQGDLHWWLLQLNSPSGPARRHQKVDPKQERIPIQAAETTAAACLEILKSSSDSSQEIKPSAFAAFNMEHHQAAVAAAAAAWDQVRLGGQYPPVSMQSG